MSMATAKDKNDRNYTISLLRFMAMTFIVLCHFLQYYGNELAWWFNVGVQMFFCISGFLYAKKQITSPIDFICKNFKKILIPYYCFLIPIIILYFVFARDSISIHAAFSALLCSNTITGIKHLWFIAYILFCYILTPLLQAFTDKMRKTKWYIYLGILFGLLMCGQLLSRYFGSFFMFSRIFCYLFGYFSSVFLQEYKSKLFIFFTGTVTFIAISLNAVRIYCKYIASYNPDSSFELFEQYSHSFFGISIVLIFLITVKNIKKNKLLELSDKFSFYIYIVHQLFILSPFNLLKITKIPALNCFITVIVILICAVILKLLSDVLTHCFDKCLEILKHKIILKQSPKEI